MWHDLSSIVILSSRGLLSSPFLSVILQNFKRFRLHRFELARTTGAHGCPGPRNDKGERDSWRQLIHIPLAHTKEDAQLATRTCPHCHLVLESVEVLQTHVVKSTACRAKRGFIGRSASEEEGTRALLLLAQA